MTLSVAITDGREICIGGSGGMHWESSHPDTAWKMWNRLGCSALHLTTVSRTVRRWLLTADRNLASSDEQVSDIQRALRDKYLLKGLALV